MLEINFVPPKLRKSAKGKEFLVGFHIPLEIVIGSFLAIVAVIFVSHTFLLFLNIGKVNEYKKLKQQWDEILPSKENADTVISEMRKMQSQEKTILNVTKGDGVLWSQKLNILSDSLDRGVWLRRLTYSEGTLFVEGSSISRDNTEMINVHSLVTNLKKEKDFLNNFTEIEMGPIQRRSINNIQIADFILTMDVE